MTRGIDKAFTGLLPIQAGVVAGTSRHLHGITHWALCWHSAGRVEGRGEALWWEENFF